MIFLFLRWAQYECREKGLIPTRENMLHVATKLFELIRFPAMSAAEFADKVGKYHIILNVSIYLQGKENYERYCL